MSDTSGPWRVVRSTSPQFNYQAVLLATAASSNPVTDADASISPVLYFYDASDEGAGEVPADQGQPTQENLYLTSLSPTSGWEGQSITINGGGFSSEPTEDQVFFGPIQAIVTGATSTALTVTVPVGVTTGPVLVQVSALTSNPLTFTAAMESSYSGNSFQNISSIVFNDRTTDATSSDHLFFSDMGSGGTADYFYEVMDDYSLTQRAFWNEIKGLAMDPSGNLYYANTTLAANTGLIKKYDTATHAVTTYTNAKLYGEANSVSIVGLAYRPDGVVFAANRYDNTIRTRLPADPGAAIFVTGYPLDLYMGMAMDSAQNLFFTSGGTLYMTPTSGSASVSTVASGFTNASGIAIDESTGNTLILIADRGASSVYLLNAQTGLKDLVTSGLTSPRAVAFGKDKVTGELYYYVAEATRVLRLPDPRIKLDSKISSGNTKVLISKRGPGGVTDSYPCSLQAHDAQIVIPFDVMGKIDNTTTVYARLYDPKDPSAYVAGANNDNRDPAKNGGVGAGTFQSLLSATSFPVSASNRHGEVTLTITNQYAGDNYQIGFSFNPAILTDASVKPNAKTGVLTAWKRLYVEVDRMYRKGGILSQDIPSTATNTIYVTKNSAGIIPNLPACSNPPTSCGYQIAIFDADHPEGSSGYQTATVINAVDDPTPGSNRMILTLDHNLTGIAYTHSPENFATGRCAGIGVIGSGYYEANGTPFYQRMKDAFVEVVFDPAQNSTVPLISWISTYLARAEHYWTKWATIWRDPLHPVYTLDNHLQLLGVESYATTGTTLAGITPGDTALGRFSGASFVFVQSIENNGGGAESDQIRYVSCHEETHNCAVSCSVSNPDIYHCTNMAYQPPSDGENCYMNNPPVIHTLGALPRPCLNHILTGGGGIVVVSTSIRDQVDPIP